MNSVALRDHAIGLAGLLGVAGVIGYIQLRPSLAREASAAAYALEIDGLNRAIAQRSAELNRESAATSALHTDLLARGAGLGSGDENARMKQLGEFAESFGLANLNKSVGERVAFGGFARTLITSQYEGTFFGIARFMGGLEDRFSDFDVQSFSVRRSGSERAVLDVRMLWITRAGAG